MLRRKMFRQCRQQRIPPFVTHEQRLIYQQRRLDVTGLPPVLLQELPDQLPPRPIISRPGQMAGKVGYGHLPCPVPAVQHASSRASTHTPLIWAALL